MTELPLFLSAAMTPSSATRASSGVSTKALAAAPFGRGFGATTEQVT